MSFFPLLTYNTLCTILTATFAVIALSEWDPVAYAISVAPVVALFVAYTLLTPQTGQRSRWLRSVDIEAAVWPLSLRVVALLAIVLGRESYVIGFPSTNALETLTLGLIKALMWYFTSQLVCVAPPGAGQDPDRFLGAELLMAGRNCGRHFLPPGDSEPIHPTD